MTSDAIHGGPSTEDKRLSRAFALSLAGHFALLALFLVKTQFFPGERTPFVPTLRVDLVGLPDLTKQEMQRIASRPAPQAAKKEAEPPKASAKDKVEPVKPGEMALERDRPKTDDREKRREKMDAALRRMQALARIQEESAAEMPEVVKGNRVSKGTSLTGEATENAAAQYLDQVLSRLQGNWSLPVWLSRQNLQAQVVVFINSYGKVQGLRWVKPSGNPQFDDAVKQCISSSEPFPLPPEGLRGGLLADGVLLGFPL